ncbi:YhhA family cyclophane-containing RiPP [Paenibacillus campi]|uniref:YhhA family cyclophane-containing RiPP n=1 Tax=Paenibacillus campi TaxID=3106031 RepID=UPI002B001342|nr:YhhA family cyclophane-containing RiPP [Paenibacillus sp. SGZ-1014]
MTQPIKKNSHPEMEMQSVSQTELQSSNNPALKRLASVINMVNQENPTANYSRMHHRHNRS